MDEPWTGAPATLANWRTAPHSAWAFHHVREIVPTAEIRNDPARVAPLAHGAALAMPDVPGPDGPIGYEDYLARCNVDAMVVARDGRILHETYRNGMDAAALHIVFSISKSMLGLLYGALVERGCVDVAAETTACLPELKGSAFEGSTLRHLLDMRSGLEFSEDYAATGGLILQYRKATNWNPLDPGEEAMDLREFLPTLTGRAGAHGGPFRYISPCTDVLGLVAERVTGRPFAEIFSEFVWRPLGAERPADITVDRAGAPRTAGGISMTARDLARVGLAVAAGGRGVAPGNWLDDIATEGDPEAWDAGDFADDFAGLSMHYRTKWYVLRDRGPILMCLGIHGQNLFVCRSTGLVMARMSSCPTPLDISGERLALGLFEAIRDGL